MQGLRRYRYGDDCPEIKLGTRDTSDTVYAAVNNPISSELTCDEVNTIVREWGQQLVGLGQADLPLGWQCDASSVCSNCVVHGFADGTSDRECRRGEGVVTFVLRFEEGAIDLGLD